MINPRLFYCIIKTIIILFLFNYLLTFANATPYGSYNLTVINSSSARALNPEGIDAYAGNVTQLNIFGYSTTQSWQGYFGNVTGVIQLGDSGDHVMYNWTDLNPKGEIYASINNSIDWTYVQCFNFSSNGSYCSDDLNWPGSTSRCGMNLSQLQADYNISYDDSDSVNNTFSLKNHEQFYTGTLEFSYGECNNLKVYNSSGIGTFDEVLLYEPRGKSVIFSSLLKRDSDGFDSKTHDFEMLVLENGHNGNVESTPYYFYLEIQ